MHDFTRRGFLAATGLGAAGALTAGLAPSSSAQEAPKQNEDVPFQLGLASYTTRKFTLPESIQMARRVGLEKICLKSFHLELDASDEECEAAAMLCRQGGLDLYGGGVIYMKDEDAVRNAFRYAKAAQMRVIVGVPVPEVLPLTNKLVQEHDILVAIHNHGPGDKVYPVPEVIWPKIEKLDPRIGFCMDIGHIVRYGADPVQDIRRYAERLHDVHLKDVTAAEAKGKTVACGRGIVDLPGVVAALKEIDYDRVASFEYEADAEDPLPGLAESVGYVRALVDVV